jgi:hypothetical protein
MSSCEMINCKSNKSCARLLPRSVAASNDGVAEKPRKAELLEDCVNGKRRLRRVYAEQPAPVRKLFQRAANARVESYGTNRVSLDCHSKLPQ